MRNGTDRSVHRHCRPMTTNHRVEGWTKTMRHTRAVPDPEMGDCMHREVPRREVWRSMRGEMSSSEMRGEMWSREMRRCKMWRRVPSSARWPTASGMRPRSVCRCDEIERKADNANACCNLRCDHSRSQFVRTNRTQRACEIPYLLPLESTRLQPRRSRECDRKQTCDAAVHARRRSICRQFRRRANPMPEFGACQSQKQG